MKFLFGNLDQRKAGHTFGVIGFTGQVGARQSIVFFPSPHGLITDADMFGQRCDAIGLFNRKADKVVIVRHCGRIELPVLIVKNCLFLAFRQFAILVNSLHCLAYLSERGPS